jgi:hypothetical protein
MQYEIFIQLKNTKYVIDSIAQNIMEYLDDSMNNIYKKSFNKEIKDHIFIGSDNTHIKMAIQFVNSIKFLNISKKNLFCKFPNKQHVFKYENNLIFKEINKITWFGIAEKYNKNYPNGYFVVRTFNKNMKTQIKLYDIKTKGFKLISELDIFDVILTNKFIICDTGSKIIIYDVNDGSHFHTFINNPSYANTKIKLLQELPNTLFVSVNYLSVCVWNVEEKIRVLKEQNPTGDTTQNIIIIPCTNELAKQLGKAESNVYTIIYNSVIEDAIVICNIKKLSWSFKVIKNMAHVFIKYLSDKYILLVKYNTGFIGILNINSNVEYSFWIEHDIKNIDIVSNNKIIINYNKKIETFIIKYNKNKWTSENDKIIKFDKSFVGNMSCYCDYVFMNSYNRNFYIFKSVAS